MRRALAIAAVVVVALCGAWFLVRDTGARDERTEALAEARAELERGGPTPNLIPAEIVEPVAETDERTQVTAPEPAPTGETATANADEAAELRVLVLDVATGEPVPGLGGSLGPLEGRQGRLWSETHEDGRLEFPSVPVGVPRLLSIEADFVADALASLELAPFEPGERRELTLEVDASVIPAYWFRCVAYEDGRPLARVRVWYFDGARGASDGTPWRRGQPEGVSDLEGLVRLAAASGGRALVFEAEGFAPGFAELWAASETSTAPARIELAAPARLEVRLRRPDGSPVSDQAVLVRAEAGELGLGLMSSRAVMGPLMHHRLEFSATTDAAGLAEFPGLPAHAAADNMTLDRPVAVVVGLPEETAEGAERGFTRLSAEPVRLVPGETRSALFTLGGAARVRGVVVDQVGASVAEQDLWLLRARATPRLFVDTEDGLDLDRALRTDGDGSFDLGEVPVGRWELFAAAARWRPGSVPPDAVAPSGVGFEVQVGTETLDLRFVVTRGLGITGRVVRGDGEPVPYCILDATASDSGFRRSTASDIDGLFSIGPLIEADYELTVHPGPWGSLAEPVHARPGDDIELRLVEAGSLRGRLVGEPDLLEVAVKLQEYRVASGALPRAGLMHILNRAEFTIGGLVPGEYTLVARASDGRVALSGGHVVAVGVAPEEVELELREGGTVRARSLAPPETEYVLVLRAGGHVAQLNRILGSDSSDLVGPAGPVVLEVWEAGQLAQSLPLRIVAGDVVRVEVGAP